MTPKSRFPWLFLMVVFKTELVSLHSGQGFILVKHANMTQSSGKITTLNGKTISDCLKACLSDCWCSAFDMRGTASIGDLECSLFRHRDKSNPNRLERSDGCSHFDIKQGQESDQQQCDASKQCRSKINCCLTSNPCKNGATCTPTDDISARFECVCPAQFTGRACGGCISGFTGENCTTKITSCRGYAYGSRIPQTYTIHDAENKSLNVFCDFEKDSNISWTLVHSYSLTNRGQYYKALWFDLPKNMESDPVNHWSSYRLSLARMKSITQNGSDYTKWRITCDFDKSLKVNMTDYIRASKADVDIMTFNVFGECKRVEFVNVRGSECSDCSVQLYQRATYPLHTDSKVLQTKCDFTPATFKECPSSGEDNFGFYNCINPQHRCSATSDSTTQIWLGG